MNLETRQHFVSQMHKTQREFDKLKAVIIDAPLEESEFASGETYLKVDNKIVSQPDRAIPMASPVVPDSITPPYPEKRKSWPMTCSKCGRSSTVPFEPKFDSKLFCPDCYHDNKRV